MVSFISVINSVFACTVSEQMTCFFTLRNSDPGMVSFISVWNSVFVCADREEYIQREFGRGKASQLSQGKCVVILLRPVCPPFSLDPLPPVFHFLCVKWSPIEFCSFFYIDFYCCLSRLTSPQCYVHSVLFSKNWCLEFYSTETLHIYHLLDNLWRNKLENQLPLTVCEGLLLIKGNLQYKIDPSE